MATGPIPFTAMLEYVRFYRFTRQEAHVFIAVLRAVDDTYLDMVAKRVNKRAK